MLFKEKNCSECGSNYDVVEATCPHCHAPNRDFKALKIPSHHVWLPIYKQLIIFLLGIVALNLVSLVLSLTISRYFEEDSVTLLLILNYTRYLVVAGAICATLIGSYPKLKNSFTDWLPYLVGFFAGFLLIGLNLAYNAAVSLFYEMETNDNQSLANALVMSYPLLSILLLGFIGPSVEEFTYRVGLFSFLTRIHRSVAYVVTILIFAFIHFDFTATGNALINEFVHLPVYMISGAALCVLYDTLGLSASLTAHVVNNILSTLPVIIVGAMQ